MPATPESAAALSDLPTRDLTPVIPHLLTGKKAALVLLFAVHLPFLLSGFLAPYDYTTQYRDHVYAAPTSGSGIHWCSRGPAYRLLGLVPCSLHCFGARDNAAPVFVIGSDGLGRDLFSRLLTGGAVSLLVAFSATLLCLALGIVIGCAAGYFGGWLDALTMRLADLFLSIPLLYLLLALRALVPLAFPGQWLLFILIGTLGVASWAKPARIIRGVVLALRTREYVQVARGLGASHLYIMWQHILPAALPVILVQSVILMPQLILTEMTLAFVGLGLGDAVPSWGALLANLQRLDALLLYPWLLIPAFALIPLTFSYYLMSRALEKENLAFAEVYRASISR